MTVKLMNLAVIRKKFIRDKLLEINKNMEKVVNTLIISLIIVSFTTFFWFKSFSEMLYC